MNYLTGQDIAPLLRCHPQSVRKLMLRLGYAGRLRKGAKQKGRPPWEWPEQEVTAAVKAGNRRSSGGLWLKPGLNAATLGRRLGQHPEVAHAHARQEGDVITITLTLVGGEDE